MTAITAATHPCLWACCLALLHDNGAINRVEGTPHRVDLPLSALNASLADWMVARLTDAERSAFVYGEEGEATAIAAQHGLGVLHAALNTWFEEGLRYR